MGGSCSKQQERQQQQREDAKKQDFQSFLGGVKQSIEDEVARKMMLQREIQLSINLAKARDNFMIFGSAWLTLVTGAGVAHVMGRPVPPVVGAPIVVGGLLLGNLADLAYGNKLNRVVNEAEYILYHERGRLVPPQQAAFFKFYTDAERALYYDTARPVGVLYPNALLFPRKNSGGGSSSDKNNSQ